MDSISVSAAAPTHSLYSRTPSAGGARDLDPGGDVGLVASGGELGAYRGELLAEDQHTCAGVFQDELEFIGDESHVERHIDGTDLGGSEEGLDELHPVHEQQPDTITGGDATAEQGIGGPVAANVELLERETTVARDVEKRLGGWLAVRPLCQELADVHHES